MDEVVQTEAAEIDLSQYTCEKCGKKGVCWDALDIFVACLCQECHDKLWKEYVQAVTGVKQDG